MKTRRRTRRAWQSLPAPLSAEYLPDFKSSPPFHHLLPLAGMPSLRRWAEMKKNPKIACLLFAVVSAVVLIPFINTYSRVREARSLLSHAKDLPSVESVLGKSNFRFDEYEKIKGLKERFGIEAGPGDILWVRNREGFPYWVILVVSSDGISVRSSYAGYYPLLK